MKLLSILALAAMLCFTTACSTLTNPNDPNAPLIHAGLQYATVKSIKSSSNPKAAADHARTVIAEMQTLVAGNGLSLSLDTLDAKVRDLIAKQATSPEDAILFDAVRQAAYNDLSARLSGGVSVTLNAQDVAAVQSILSDIAFGIQVSGY